MSRRTIRDDERVVAELHRLLGVLPADERPMPDIHIDKDAMYARLMAKFDAEEQQARQLAAATAHARRHDRGGLGWFVAPRWVTAAAAAVVIIALVMVLDIGRAPIAHAATPQLLLYSLTDAADIYKANPARETLVTLQRRADAGRFTPATVAASVQYVAVSAWLLAWPTDETDRTVVQPTAGQRWLAADGSARTAEFRGAPLGLDGRFDATLPESAAGPESSDDFPAGTFDATTPSRLPRDRAALRQALISTMAPIDCASTPGQATSCLIDAVRALYAAYVIPSDLAAALWGVLSDEPGLKDLGTTTDRIGRAAHGIAFNAISESGASRVIVLLISPDDGQLIGTETVTLTEPALGITSATVTEFETYTARAWVPAIGDLPR